MTYTRTPAGQVQGAPGQSADDDLTALAGLDSSTSGAIASDGAGWIKKTYAQFKTALGLVKGDVGLGSVDNTSDTAKPVSTATQTALDVKQPLDSDLTTIAALTATTDNFMVAASSAWASRTPTQAKTSLALAKSDVGLGNVDNTSDTNKPVSTATQTALDAKQALDSDLTTIAGLTATTDNFLQAKSSAWASRTVAQVQTDLSLLRYDTAAQGLSATQKGNARDNIGAASGMGYTPPTGAYLQPSHMQTSAVGTPTTGRALFMPLDPGPAGMTLQSLSVNVTTALVIGAGNPVFTLGIYADDGTGGAPLLSAPGLLFSGALDPSSTGARHVSTSLVLTGGRRYWAAFLLYQTVAPTTAAIFSCLLSTTSLWSVSGSVPGAAARALLATGQTALPTSAVTWAVTASTEAPTVCARAA